MILSKEESERRVSPRSKSSADQPGRLQENVQVLNWNIILTHQYQYLKARGYYI